MSSKKTTELRQSILKYNTELSQLKKHLSDSEFANERYNKIVIQKAICKKQLTEESQRFFHKIIKKFSIKSEKLICDYFN